MYAFNPWCVRFEKDPKTKCRISVNKAFFSDEFINRIERVNDWAIEWESVLHFTVVLVNVWCALEHKNFIIMFSRVCCDVQSVSLRGVFSFFLSRMLQATSDVCEQSSNVIREKRDRSHSHYPISHTVYTKTCARFGCTFYCISSQNFGLISYIKLYQMVWYRVLFMPLHFWLPLIFY